MLDRFPMVSVIVPTYKDAETLKLCLVALRGQTYPCDRYEVLVVNNDPSIKLDLSCLLTVDPSIKVIDEVRPGSYVARNSGIDSSSGEILAFTDADCLPDSLWIEQGVTAILSDPSIGRVGGRVELVFEGPDLSIAEVYEKLFSFKNDKNIELLGASVTANLFVKREVFNEVGLFDPTLFSGGDMKWGIQAQAHGSKIVYQGSCVVFHPARSNLGSIFKKARRVAGGVSATSLNKTQRKSKVKMLHRIRDLFNEANVGVFKFSFAILLAIFVVYYKKLIRMLISRKIIIRSRS